MRNYEIAADNIIRCKDCINNPFVKVKGFSNHMCPLDNIYRDDDMVIIDGEEYYYPTTVNENWEDPYNGDWFCANGESAYKL